MAQEHDISWQTLGRIVRRWAGEAAELDGVQPLVGGCINTTLALSLADGRRAVLKITPHRVDRAHVDEAAQLRLMRRLDLPAPQVYDCHVADLDEPFSYVLMEFIEGVDLAQARQQCTQAQYEDLSLRLAELVLQMHGHASTHYMRISAETVQRFDNWGVFFRHTFDSIWRQVDSGGLLPIKLRKIAGRVHDRLDQLLAHDDCPRLIHSDLWATNVLARPDEAGAWRVVALLDPNCKYGHYEAEIAYLELFHTATPAFLKAYRQVYKLTNDYQQIRKPIYQLYSLLNHLRLFGQEYLKAVVSAVERVAPLV